MTVTATPSATGASALAGTCAVGDDYWSVSVASYAQRDDAGAVDALLVAMGCGPVAGSDQRRGRGVRTRWARGAAGRAPSRLVAEGGEEGAQVVGSGSSDGVDTL